MVVSSPPQGQVLQSEETPDHHREEEQDMVLNYSDLIIPGLVTNGTAKICCLSLILAQLYSTMVIKNNFE